MAGKRNKRRTRKYWKLKFPGKKTEKYCSELYMRSFAADGNFKANHLVQKNAENDVHLTKGECFMMNESEYQRHLKIAVESPQVRGIKSAGPDILF